MTELVETAPHEFNAQYNFAGGLDGYFATDRATKDGDGTRKATVEYAGERWAVTLYYQDSNIVHPGERTPAGTPFRLDTIREFRLSVDALEGDDMAGEKGFNAHIRPRWDGMTTEDSYGDEHTLQVPFTEGVNVHVQGSNIEFQTYLPFLHRALSAVDVNARYFEDPHKSSTVQQAERYVRVHEDHSGPVHARDGPLARMGHLLEADRDGRREVEQTDVAEDGETVPGYRHQVGLDERRVQKIHPNHRLPKRVKHYRARQSHNLDRDNPLRHPKVGTIYYGSLWRDRDQSLGVDQLEELTEELEETLLSVLSDAGLDVTSTAQFVADDYFCATTSDRERQVVDLPLENIEQRQENVVINHLYDGLSPVQEQTLETLVTDGGQVSPKDVADEGDFHLRSVYRALDEMSDVVQHEYDSLSLQSTYVGELVHTAITEAREQAREAVKATAKAARAERRGLDEHTSALVAWAERHVDNFREAPDGLEVNVGTVKASDPDEARRRIRKILRDGAELWCDSRDTTKWRLGEWRAVIEVPKHYDLKSIDSEDTDRRVVGGRLWKTAPP